MVRSIVLSGLIVLLRLTAAERKCEEGQLPCDDGQCVRKEDWCDGETACDDESDEAYCTEYGFWDFGSNKCDKKIHFKCDDGLCWPLVARCDGNADCRDGSDEKKCDSKPRMEDPDETEENTEDEKNKTEDNSKEFSEEEEESKESSEKFGSDEDLTTTEIFPTTTTPDNYSDYEDLTTEPALQITTIKDISSPRPPFNEAAFSIDEFPLVSSKAPLWFQTTEMDFYAKRMEQSEVKQQYSTRIKAASTSTYRPPLMTPAVQYPTRPFKNRHQLSKNTAVPYSGPTRAYTPRPYRYVGKQYTGQTPLLHRGQHPIHHSPNNYHYQSSDYNYISSQSRTNQHYRNDRIGSNSQNGVTRLPKIYGRQLRSPSRFYFRKNYNEIYERANYESVKSGAEWILSIQNASGGWGKETPRALVALSLVNNSFLAGNHENDLMQKYFQVYVGVNLLRDEPVSLNRLAMFVNALIATCHDPRDFHGWDLTELIRNTILKLHRGSRPPIINPLVYLSLCLADRNLTHYEVHHLMTYLVATRDDEATRGEVAFEGHCTNEPEIFRQRDRMSLALVAFTCHMQKEINNRAQHYSLQKLTWNATSKILQRMKEDGSFGSIYSTAIAAQALMSINDTVEWNPELTFRFLKSHQQRNGSFGDFLATYHALPALGGRSLLHLRNTECNPPRVNRELSPQEILQFPAPKSYIRYSLHMGSPLAAGFTVQLLVPNGINFFDVMRVAAYEDDRFKFSYEEVDGKISVYSISDIPNDPEEGLTWQLYVRRPPDNGNIPSIQQLYTGDIREFLPTPDQHIIFWYHPLGF